jgi:hypothetical protein
MLACRGVLGGVRCLRQQRVPAQPRRQRWAPAVAIPRCSPEALGKWQRMICRAGEWVAGLGWEGEYKIGYICDM